MDDIIHPDDIDDLLSIEDFFDYFGVGYDVDIMQKQRVPLLRLFQAMLPDDEQGRTYRSYQQALVKAYCGVVKGDSVPALEMRCGGCHECETSSEEGACCE
ncbi:Nitrogen fixation protein NifW [Vibrio xiamenensis]|uniref:Nitrogenase-stabilizing/protective protein NifW n=1 Tax=Vibrio xiamenensis TaxID=861298 RepID=A0A1G8D1I2_9VIBR|nr:nitrogenase-stabilizing/protective protein NifW [Vibrio xiamenensis]SDH51542.1 Nitrogen fixation protein NifW [Vibrio xiamenensis]